jgi:DMSO/TMAO reductase YedYZ heme-binding membrane subunit
MNPSMTKGCLYLIALVATFAPLLATLEGLDLDNVHKGVVMTARTAFVFFLVVYFARPIKELTGLKWLLRYRRTLGLCVAIAMTVHYSFLVAYFSLSEESATDNMLRFVTGMMGGSFRALGQWWRRIHRAGIHYLWFFFFVSFQLGANKLAVAGDPRVSMMYGFMALMLAGLASRVWLFAHSQPPTAPPG